MRLKYLFFCFIYCVISGNSELLLAQDDYFDEELEPTVNARTWVPDPNSVSSKVMQRMSDLLQAKCSADEIVATIKNEFEHSDPGPGDIIRLNVCLDDGTTEQHIIDTSCHYERFEEIPPSKSFFSATGKRHFLLKVALPVGITAALFYLLYQHYRTICQTTIPDLGVKALYASLFGESWSHYWLQAAEIATAVGRISAVVKKPNNLLVNVLRIANGLLFLINKKQLSPNAFTQGAYYSEAWLIYDLYNVIREFFYDRIPASNDDVWQDTNYDNLGKLLSAHVLPLAESLSVIYLALSNDDTPAAQKNRLKIQSICSLARTLSLYLKEKREAIDILLVVHLLVTILEFFRELGPVLGNGGLKINTRADMNRNLQLNYNQQQLGKNQSMQDDPVGQSYQEISIGEVPQAAPKFGNDIIGHSYIEDTWLSEAVAQQVEYARSRGLETDIVHLPPFEDVENNISLGVNQRFNDLIEDLMT